MQMIKCANAQVERRCVINRSGTVLIARAPGEASTQFFHLSAGEFPSFTPVIVTWVPSIFRTIGNNDGLTLETFGDMALVSDETAPNPVVDVYAVAAGRKVNALTGFKAHPASLVFSSDGKHFLVGGNEKTVTEWNAATLEHTQCGFSLRQATFSIVHYDRDSRLVVVSYSMGGYGVYDLSNRRKDKHFRRSEAVPEELVTIFAGGKKLLSKSGSVLGVFDLESGELEAIYRYHSDVLSGMFADPDRGFLFTSQWTGSGRVAVWDFQQQKVVAVLSGHTSEVRAIAMNPARTKIITGGSDGVVKLWNAATLECLATMDLGGELLRFTPVLDHDRFYAVMLGSKSVLVEI